MNKPGIFVVSLDYEQYYGISALPNTEYWKKSVLGGKKAIPHILDLFSQYHIHATWATVGMLFAQNKQDLLSLLPVIRPQEGKSNYDMDRFGTNEATDPYHFSGNIIDQILATPNQEIGSHTFSHLFCLDDYQDESVFAADCDAFNKAVARKNIKVTSFVFPKNQVKKEYIEILKSSGIAIVRGTENSWLYKPTGGKESLIKRALRLADSYVNISGMNCYDINKLELLKNVLILPSSCFFRPYSHSLRFFERIKMCRIKKQMTYAAKNGLIYHIWWHPHNFGYYTEENLNNLETILKHYEYLEKKYHMMSMSMAEIVEARK